jgi:hypothetical protein
VRQDSRSRKAGSTAKNGSRYIWHVFEWVLAF